MNAQHMVHILDDDANVRKSLAFVLESAGLACTTHESGRDFLEAPHADCPSALILDLQMPGLNGVELLREMKNFSKMTMPVVVLSGTGSVPLAVQSMHLGVYDFLEKPADHEVLLEKLREALELDAARRDKDAVAAEARRRLAELTDRERQVFELICEGKSNKQMAATLGISIKTVSIHRWHMMRKMQATNAAEVMLLAASVNSVLIG
jgi:FixJ family two-component response regulator